MEPGELWVSCSSHSSHGWEVPWWGAGQQDWSQLGGCHWVPRAQHMGAQVQITFKTTETNTFPGLLSSGDPNPGFWSWASQLLRKATVAPVHVMSPVARVVVFSFLALQSSRRYLWCCLAQEVPHFSFLLWENAQRTKNNKF